MRREFELTPEQHAKLMDACQPVMCIMVGGYLPASPQENANNAWRDLGAELGFDWQTVQPSSSENDRLFTAVAIDPPALSR